VHKDENVITDTKLCLFLQPLRLPILTMNNTISKDPYYNIDKGHKKNIFISTSSHHGNITTATVSYTRRHTAYFSAGVHTYIYK
jgi:hypothetical protein